MISAIILAAGQSIRMGRNKLLLPFGQSTALETIVTEIAACDQVRDIVVVTGHEHDRIEALLAKYPARYVFNPDYAQAEMLVSIQVGLRALSADVTAALIVLGDQPRLQRDIVQRIIEAYVPDRLVIPSYQMKRGHPILIPRSLWPHVLSVPKDSTLRDVIRAHADRIDYVEAENDSVLKDIDTPEDYQTLIHR
jgi:molybdenum cofactor cytidylyltransferase